MFALNLTFHTNCDLKLYLLLVATKKDPTSAMGLILQDVFAPVMTFDLIMHETPSPEAACLCTATHC